MASPYLADKSPEDYIFTPIEVPKEERKGKGRKSRARKIARNMKAKGYPIADIAEITKLLEQDIEEL